MDASLKDAISVNTEGVLRMIDISLQMKQLQVSFLHLFHPDVVMLGHREGAYTPQLVFQAPHLMLWNQSPSSIASEYEETSRDS